MIDEGDDDKKNTPQRPKNLSKELTLEKMLKKRRG